MNFCPQCGTKLVTGVRFCSGCGAAVAGSTAPAAQGSAADHPADATTVLPIQPVVLPPSRPASLGAGYNAAASNGPAASMSQPAGWPIPDRTIAVNGQHVNLELAVVAGLHALGALALLISVWELVKVVPGAIGSVFSSEPFVFAISWVILFIGAVLLWLVGLMALAAYEVFRGSPVGRGLVTLFAVVLLLTVLTAANVPGFLWFVLLVSAGCCAVLWLSPNVKRVYAAWSGDRPWEVTFAITVGIWYFSQVVIGAVLVLPGLRFASTLGGQWILCMLGYIAAAVLGVIGLVRLRRGPDKQARILLVTGAAVLALGLLILGGGGSWSAFAQGFALLAALAWGLFVAPASRRWFGDAGPLFSTSGLSTQ